MSPELMGWIKAGVVLLMVLAAWAVWSWWRRRRGGPGRESRPARRSGTSGSLGNAFLEVQALLEPDRRHVLEVRRLEDGEDDASGDPPEPGVDPPAR